MIQKDEGVKQSSFLIDVAENIDYNQKFKFCCGDLFNHTNNDLALYIFILFGLTVGSLVNAIICFMKT